MNKYIIHGGRPLFGEVTISGAKNAAVAIIPAALLVDGVCRIENIPQISDVTLFFSILDELGARVRVLNQHAVEIDCRTVRSTHPSYDMARRIRAARLSRALPKGAAPYRKSSLTRSKPQSFSTRSNTRRR